MSELIEQFLAELPDRMSAIQQALETDDLERLRRAAHQLRGAGAGYGYPSITEFASMLERTLLDLATDDSLWQGEAGLSAVTERAEDLLAICRRAAKVIDAEPPGAGDGSSGHRSEH